MSTKFSLILALAIAGCSVGSPHKCGPGGSEPCHEFIITEEHIEGVGTTTITETHRPDLRLLNVQDPIFGSDYRFGRLQLAIRQQKQRLYDHNRQLAVLVNSYCASDTLAGADDFRCDAAFWVIRTRGESAGEELGSIRGDFETVLLHPDLPLLVTLSFGCCDTPASLTVYDLKGRIRCPTTLVSPYLSSREYLQSLIKHTPERFCPDPRIHR